MSNDKIEPDKCFLSTQSYVLSKDELLTNSSENEKEPVAINIFSKDDIQKVDKLLQLGASTNDSKNTILLDVKSSLRQSPNNSIFKTESKDFEKQDQEERKRKILPEGKPLVVPLPHKLFVKNSMESRKSIKGNVNSKTTTDMAKKKLEAELKAAEEIAKLKETIIEKRLALELASLEDTFDSSVKEPVTSLPLPPPPVEKKILEIPPKRVFSALQDNLTQERENLDFTAKRPLPPRAPVFPVSSGPSRQHSPNTGKVMKTDSSSSVLTSVRNLNLIEKLNMDKKFYGQNESRSSNPMTLSAPREFRDRRDFRDSRDYRDYRDCRDYRDYRDSRDYRYMDSGYKMYERNSRYERERPAYNVPQSKARMVWKAAVSKIRKKIRAPKKYPEDEPPSPMEFDERR